MAALAVARFEIHAWHIRNPKAIGASHSGLLGSDAAWYYTIAAKGYGASPRPALRFFPIFPGVSRLFHDVTSIPIGGALVITSNACALVATMIISYLACRELRDSSAGRRAAWLFNLAPPAFVYVMGYSESLLILLVTGTFLCLRRQCWWWAALWGLLAGAARPIGFLLVVPAIIEGQRDWRDASHRSKLARAGAAIAPITGLVAFLTWVGITFGDPLAPLRYQRYGVSKSVSRDPFVNVYRDISAVLRGTHFGSGSHLFWIALALFLCVIAFRRLPSSYGGYAVAVVAAALAGTNFESFERYAFSAFGLAIAAVTTMRSRRVEATVLVLCTLGLFGYAVLAFQGAYVP